MFACLPVCLSLPASLPLHVSLPAAYTKATPCKGKTCCGYTSLALVTCCPHCFVAPLALVNCCSPCSGRQLPPLALVICFSPLRCSPVAHLALVTCCPSCSGHMLPIQKLHHARERHVVAYFPGKASKCFQVQTKTKWFSKDCFRRISTSYTMQGKDMLWPTFQAR